MMPVFSISILSPAHSDPAPPMAAPAADRGRDIVITTPICPKIIHILFTLAKNYIFISTLNSFQDD